MNIANNVAGLKIEIIELKIDEWLFTASMFYQHRKYQISGTTSTPDKAFSEAMKFVDLVTTGLST